MEKRSKKFFVILLGILFVCNSYIFAAGQVGEKAPNLKIGGWATQNRYDSLDLTGNVCIVEFWATWCGPCVKNIPHMNDLTRKYTPKGVKVIALSGDKSLQKLKEFVNYKGIKYPVAIDMGTVNAFGVTGYPTLFVTNAKGQIVWRGYPWTSGLEKAVDKALEEWPEGVDEVDLGPLKSLEPRLHGGKDFKKAYDELQLYSAETRDKKAGFATRILAAINNAISKKINLARSVEKRDPKTASKMLASVVNQYGDIAPTKKAVEELKKLNEKKK